MSYTVNRHENTANIINKKNGIRRIRRRRLTLTNMVQQNLSYRLGIDIGSTTVKIAVLDKDDTLLFADYERHYANIQETLAALLSKAEEKLGILEVSR